MANATVATGHATQCGTYAMWSVFYAVCNALSDPVDLQQFPTIVTTDLHTATLFPVPTLRTGTREHHSKQRHHLQIW